MGSQIFVSYSRRDSDWKDLLGEQLGAFVNIGLLDLWTDDRIEVGDDWLAELDDALASAAAAVLLVSASFLSSPFVRDHEVPKILERRAAGMPVIPILVRPCAWRAVPWLAQMQMLPGDGDTISSGSPHDIDRKLANAAEAIADRVAADSGERSSTSRTIASAPTPWLLGDSARTAQYVCYVARKRVKSIFDQVDAGMLEEAMRSERLSHIEFGGDPRQHDRRTLSQLDVALRYLEQTATIADLNATIAKSGRLDADWYYLKTGLRVVGWNDDDPSLRLEGSVTDYSVQLSCAKQDFSGLNPEGDRYIPTSTNWFLFDGVELPMYGLIRLAALDRGRRLLMGSPLYLVLDRIDMDLSSDPDA